MTDPIADLLTRIRNALRARHAVVTIPLSKEKVAVLKVMQEAGYIAGFTVEEEKPQGKILVTLKYDSPRKPAIRELKRVSKPGGRIYSGYKDLRPYLGGVGIRIISTPKGIIDDKQARKTKVGGEVLCEIW